MPYSYSSYHQLNWVGQDRTMSCTSNQHFYPICNNTYKDSYVSGSVCMMTPPGGHMNSKSPCQENTRLTDKQLRLVQQSDEKTRQEEDEYEYARTKGHLIHQNRRTTHR